MKIHPNTSMKYSTNTTSMRCIHIRFSRCVCVCVSVYVCAIGLSLCVSFFVSLCAFLHVLFVCVSVWKRLAMGDDESGTSLTWLSITITFAIAWPAACSAAVLLPCGCCRCCCCAAAAAAYPLSRCAATSCWCNSSLTAPTGHRLSAIVLSILRLSCDAWFGYLW